MPHTDRMGALGPDLSSRTDRDLRRLRAAGRVSALVFGTALVVGLVLWARPLPPPEAGLITLILVLTGALNLPISLYGLWRLRRQIAERWYERELWVQHEAARPVIMPTPSVALARLRARPPAA